MSRLERIECEVLVLKDLLARSKWYYTDEPTEEERAWFLQEVRATLNAEEDTEDE